MSPILYTNTNKKLSWQPRPSSFRQATNGNGYSINTWYAEEDFGSVYIEEYKSSHFTIQHNSFQLKKGKTFYYYNTHPCICIRIITKNKWHFDIGYKESIHLLEGQFALYSKGSDKEKIIFEKEGEYHSFEVFFLPERLLNFVHLFPVLEEFLCITETSKPSLFTDQTYRAIPEVLDIVRHIHKCPFDDSIKDYYIQSKLEYLVFLLIITALKEKTEDMSPTKEEVTAVQVAEKIIMTDIKQHYPIPYIARKVGLNEFRLKYAFKYIFKTGIFEYLLQARMQEAKKLLTFTDKPLKEIASLTGYQRLTSFITAFKKYFGYTPGAVRKAESDLLIN